MASSSSSSNSLLNQNPLGTLLKLRKFSNFEVYLEKSDLDNLAALVFEVILNGDANDVINLQSYIKQSYNDKTSGPFNNTSIVTTTSTFTPPPEVPAIKKSSPPVTTEKKKAVKKIEPKTTSVSQPYPVSVTTSLPPPTISVSSFSKALSDSMKQDIDSQQEDVAPNTTAKLQEISKLLFQGVSSEWTTEDGLAKHEAKYLITFLAHSSQARRYLSLVYDGGDAVGVPKKYRKTFKRIEQNAKKSFYISRTEQKIFTSHKGFWFFSTKGKYFKEYSQVLDFLDQMTNAATDQCDVADEDAHLFAGYNLFELEPPAPSYLRNPDHIGREQFMLGMYPNAKWIESVQELVQEQAKKRQENKQRKELEKSTKVAVNVNVDTSNKMLPPPPPPPDDDDEEEEEVEKPKKTKKRGKKDYLHNEFAIEGLDTDEPDESYLYSDKDEAGATGGVKKKKTGKRKGLMEMLEEEEKLSNRLYPQHELYIPDNIEAGVVLGSNGEMTNIIKYKNVNNDDVASDDAMDETKPNLDFEEQTAEEDDATFLDIWKSEHGDSYTNVQGDYF